jgi:xanthine dehydrogenase YagR molybdenum-binding subunit
VTAAGRSVSRVEGRDKVTGAAIYTADVSVPNVAHAVLVQSTIPHGRVVEESLRTATRVAETAPGVLSVLTPLNCPPLNPPAREMSHDFPIERRPPLADLTVQHVGQHIAVVVADTLENATHAASLMAVDYEVLPAQLSMSEVLSQPVVPDDANGWVRHGTYRPDHFVKLEEERLQDRRGPDRAPEDGVDVTGRFSTPVNAHYPIELSATTAHWDGDMLTVHDTTRWIMGERATLAGYLGIPEDHVRVLAPLVGGAFGSKSFLWMHVALCAAAAREVRRPVRLVLTRAQMFTSTGHRPRTDQHLSLVAETDGAIVSTEHHTLTETSTIAHFCEPVGLSTRLLYQSPRMEVSHTVARINSPTPCFMRGPGEAPGLFALEVAMDELAYATGVDPVALRLRNDPGLDQTTGRPWSGKHLLQCYRQGAHRFGWHSRPMEPRSLRRGCAQIGWGMATATYPGRRMPAGCRVTTSADGLVRFASATHEVGQGVRTVMCQVAADAAGLPLSAVAFDSGDSLFPRAPYSGASQTTAAVGSAVHQAATQWRSRLVAWFSERGGVDGRSVTELLHDGGMALLERLTFTVDSAGPDENGPVPQSFGAHFCEVEVDEEIGRATVTRWVAVMDCGRVLNPRLAHNQVMGGVLFGLGMALMEQLPVDRHSGLPIGEYHLPTHADVPDFDIGFVNVPDLALDPIGVRGIGEIGTCGVPAAIANAIHHATGRRLRDLPITVEDLMTPFDAEELI